MRHGVTGAASCGRIDVKAFVTCTKRHQGEGRNTAVCSSCCLTARIGHRPAPPGSPRTVSIYSSIYSFDPSVAGGLGAIRPPCCVCDGMPTTT